MKPKTTIAKRAKHSPVKRRPRAETTTARDPAQWFLQLLGGNTTTSGENVNTRTVMGIPAYFACLRNISEDIGKTARHTYQETDKGKRKAPEHPTYPIVHITPNDEMGALDFHQTVTQHAIGWGGGFAEIVKRGDGRPAQLWPMDPTTITIVRLDTPRRELRYKVSVPGMSDVFLRPDQVIHIRGLSFDGICGYKIWWVCREILGAVLARQNFGGSFFGNGAQPSGLLEVPAGFSQKALANLRESFKQRYEGSENKGKTMLLEAGVTYKPVTFEPQKSQMMESIEFDIWNVCTLFRCTPNYIGSFQQAQGWSTREQTASDTVYNTLMGWYKRWEEEYQRKLFLKSEQSYFVKHNTNDILRADSAARAAFHTAMFHIGAASQNDILESEDKNTIGPDGDVYYVPANMIPSSIAAKGPQTPNPASPETPPNPGRKPAAIASIMAIARPHELLLEGALNRALAVETRKVKQAAKSEDEAAAIGNFYAEHVEHVIAAIGHVVEAFCASSGAQLDVFTHVRSLAAQHVEKSLVDTRTDGAMELWTSGARARSQAAEWMAKMVEIACGSAN